MTEAQLIQRRRELGEDLMQEWDMLHCIVNDDDMVMHERTGKNGKIIPYLDFRKQV
jgi:hypothetical protein